MDNRGGAGGAIGTEIAVRSAPDGYTLLMATASTIVINPLVNEVRFDPIRDFDPVVHVSTVPLILVVHPSVPVKSVREQIGLAKAQPGKINFASSGEGTISRAIRLILLNLGGGISGKTSATVFGSPFRYTACVTENAEENPWGTLAVSRGYSPQDDVITCVMAESPRLHFDDVSTEPQRLLIGIGDAMTAPGSWNMWFVSDMVVAMSPQHARLCVQGGMSRADVVRRLAELAVRRQSELKRGGNWRPERAREMGVDPNDDSALIRAVKDPDRMHLIVAGGYGLITGVCHGWNETSRAVHGTYEV